MNSQMVIVNDVQPANGTIEISVQGRWVQAPACQINGQTIVVKGRHIRIAGLHDEDWLETEIADPEACLRSLKQRPDAPRADIFAFSQKVPHIVPRYKYHMEMRSVAVADVASFKAWWERLPQETRKNVRRSQRRGVILKVQSFSDDVVTGIMSIQNESPMRQGRRYYHYGKSFVETKRDHGAFLDRSDFICAYCGDEFIGFLKLVYRGNVASILQLNSKVAHRDKRPSNALIAKAAELCEAKGISHLTYGLFNYGNKGDSPLREFKVRSGFHEMLVPAYYVPLTVWGKFCVWTGLHRGLIGILPSSVISVALNVRAKWYEVNAQRSKRNSMLGQSNDTRPAGPSNPPAGPIS